MLDTSEADGELRFRSFEVDAPARLLRRGGEAVELGSRAFDLLIVLLKARGSVVSKNDIVRYVWPDTQVDESNLRFQMSSLRNALGLDRDVIRTIPGRGYLFLAEPAPARPLHATPRQRSRAGDGPGTEGGMARPSVAIIEDNAETREALVSLLQSAGVTVEAFSSVREFAEREGTDAPGCLILDVLLPGQSGIDFQAELRRSGLAIPVIFISGHADVHMGVEAMKGGALEFLVKPVRYRDLLTAVAQAVSGGGTVTHARAVGT